MSEKHTSSSSDSTSNDIIWSILSSVSHLFSIPKYISIFRSVSYLPLALSKRLLVYSTCLNHTSYCDIIFKSPIQNFYFKVKFKSRHFFDIFSFRKRHWVEALIYLICEFLIYRTNLCLRIQVQKWWTMIFRRINLISSVLFWNVFMKGIFVRHFKIITWNQVGWNILYWISCLASFTLTSKSLTKPSRTKFMIWMTSKTANIT